MSNLLDDDSEETIAEEQLENIRALALVFVAKCLVNLFFRLQTNAFIIDVNYIWWVLVLVEVVAVQRALYAFYRWKDKAIITYLRLFYIGVGLLFLISALSYTNWIKELLYLYYWQEYILIFLDASVSLLLVRYYFNRLERPQYWLFMENLLLWGWGIILLSKITIHLIYNYEIGTGGGNLSIPIYVSYFFEGVFIIAALACAWDVVKKVEKENRLLTFLSLLAVVCWKLGIYFDAEHRMTLELLLFAGTILAVLAYASSFTPSSKKDE